MAREKEDDLKNPFEKGVRRVDLEQAADEGAGVEVKLRDPDDDDDDDDDEPSSPAAASPTREPGAAQPPREENARTRRSRDRYRENKEARIRAEQELERERAERRALEERLRQPAPTPQGASLDDQYREALNQVYSAKESLAAEYAHAVAKGALDDSAEGKQLKRSFWERHQALDTHAQTINQRYAAMQNPANHPQHAQRQAVMNWLQMEHGDVLAHPMANAVLQYTVAEEARLVQSGAPKTLETSKRAIEAAKQHFGLSKRPAPSPAVRARYDGASSGGGVGGGAAARAPNTIVLTPAQQQMAEARFPNVPKGEAFKRWANGPGRKMLENKAAARSR